MSTVLQPDTPSGTYRIHRTGPVRSAPTVAPAPRRLDHVDLLRGLVMVIMVLDHARAYFTEASWARTDSIAHSCSLFKTMIDT